MSPPITASVRITLWQYPCAVQQIPKGKRMTELPRISCQRALRLQQDIEGLTLMFWK